MKKLKSIMCKAMSVIMLCTFILPLMPTIDVKAANSYKSETITVKDEWESYVHYMGLVKPMNVTLLDNSIKHNFAVKDKDTNLTESVEEILNKYFMSKFGITDSISTIFSDNHINLSNIIGVTYTVGVNEQDTTTDCMAVVIGTDKTSGELLTVVSTVVDSKKSNITDSIGLYILKGLWDIGYTNTTKENAEYHVNVMSLLDDEDIINIANALIDTKAITSEFESGKASNQNLYNRFDKVFTNLGDLGSSYLADKIVNSLSGFTVLGLKTEGRFNFVEHNEGSNAYNIFREDSTTIKTYDAYVTTWCNNYGGDISATWSLYKDGASNEIAKGTGEGGLWSNPGDGILRYLVLDPGNVDFVNFGDAKIAFEGTPDADDIKSDISPNRKVQGDFTAIPTLISNICSSFTEGNVEDFQNKLGTFITSINDVDGNPPIIKQILSTVQEQMVDQAQKWQMASAQEFYDSNSLELNASNDYEAMSAILGASIQSISSNKSIIGNTYKYGSNYVCITANSTDAIPDRLKTAYSDAMSTSDLWDKLTDYQKSILAVTYKNVIDSRDFSKKSGVISCIYSAGVSGSYDSGTAEDFVQDGHTTLIDDIKNVISNKDKSLTDTYSVYNIARNANTLCQYIVGTALYGDSQSGDIYSLYDATLAGFITKDYTQSNINTDYYPQNIIGDIGLFGDNSNYFTVLLSTENGFEPFASYLYNVSYAFDVAAFSDGGEELNYDPEALREFFKSGNYKVTDTGSDYATTVSFSWVAGDGVKSLDGTKVQFSGDDVSKNMLRSIIELHDMCEFLGVLDSAKNGGWTEAIEQYLGIYDDNKDFFDALRSNPEIYSKAEEGKTTADEPLGVFFNLKDKKMSDQWCKGFAISALYVPMETNLYDANSIAYLNDPNFISDFYYKFAFYRKALYINTDNSAIVNNKVSGEVSGTRVATLNDLLNYDRDIILTVDDNFYNAKDINSVIGKLDYSSVRNGSETNTDNAWESMKNWVGDLFNLSPEQILKTGPNAYYSSTLANTVTKLGGTPTLTSSIADVYVLSENDLIGENNVFDEYEYSVKQSYGVVSAVYRSAELYNECLRALATDNAVFKSSKGICSTPGTTSSDWRSVYNYCMLANLEDQMKNDSASTLDLNAPIFCDLFGNIVTESGLVIIPAASNATLCGTNWNPNTVGWSEYYNNGNRLKIDEFTDDVYTWLTGIEYKSDGSVEQQVQYVDHYDDDGNPVYKTYTITAADSTNVGKYGEEVNRENAGGYMIVDRSGQLVLRTSALAGGSSSAIVQWENLNKNSTVVKDLFYNDAYFNKAKSGEIYSKTLVNMVVETLRGAPIEYIDYEYEGLSGNADISKFGVYMAYKLEELTNALISGTNGSHTGGNSMVTIPNPAFITGIEYAALYIFKIMFAVLLIGFVVSLYLDAVKNHLGIKSLGKFVVTCLLTIVAIVFVPNIMSWSYYRANKDLLADESGYIMMLNYVKDYDGAEIGITSITTPETNTELYVKLDDISVNWWDVIGEVLFNNTYKTVSELYKSQLTDNAMAMQENVQIKGDGLYMNVKDIFDSTSVVYYPSQNRIANIAYSNGGNVGTAGDKDSVVSFCMPYYVILDKLVANIDEYNQSKDITAYSWSVGSNGHIMTYDIISPYLTSSEFLDEGYDILGLNEALDTDNHMTSYTEGYFSTAQKDRMKLSRWYPTGSTKDQLTQDRINAVYTYARDYIAQNREVLGKVPDEVFIKTFAMQLAIEFNKQFNVHTTNSIEIMNIDTRDLARFLVADKGSVYKYFSYGFSRFTYEESGTIGVILSAIYFVVLWLTSWLKLIAIFFVLCLLILNVLLRKTLLRRESRCIEGYLISCACLVLCNYAYSFMLKASMLVSETGLGTVAGLSLAILVQVLYVFGLTCICVIQVKDWRNNGFYHWKDVGAAITSEMLHVQNVVADKVMSMISSSYGDSKTSRRYQSGNYDSNSVDEMMERDEEREERGTYSPA